MPSVPAGDYSLGAFACLLRGLLMALGHESATIVSQSLGGGVAMQLAYQHPEGCKRLVLVAAGGLGREVNPCCACSRFPAPRPSCAWPALARSRAPWAPPPTSPPGRPPAWACTRPRS